MTVARRCLLAGAALAALLAPVPALAVDTLQIRRPGHVLFDHDARAAKLAAAPMERRIAACRARDMARGPVKPVRRLQETSGYGGDNAAEPFTWAVMDLSGEFLATGDPATGRAAAAQLLAWAEAGALLRTGDLDDASTVFSIKRLALPVIQAYAVLEGRGALTPQESARLRGWLDALVRLADRTFGDNATADRNNHRYLRDAVNAAWGAATGDAARFALGVTRYVEALDQMRPDGSWPLEARRGARALWYMRQSIATLVAIAEIAATQGYDLYAVQRDGRDLHLALKYTLDAMDDPRLILGYAEENYIPGPSDDWRRQDMGFLEIRINKRHYMAWAEAYLRRFPDHPNSARLRALMERAGVFAARPLIDDFSGGNGTCFWAGLQPASPNVSQTNQ